MIAAIATLALAGCASDAWTDKHDGQGMRGWAGVPLQQTLPVAQVNPVDQPTVVPNPALYDYADGERVQRALDSQRIEDIDNKLNR